MKRRIWLRHREAEGRFFLYVESEMKYLDEIRKEKSVGWREQ